ncbi:MAG TPA: alpha-L-fucosidase [Bacteroidales bacterium]|nr:alpha-L-fucosidase [Bacteroidales bacterium]HPT01504.1 alpha-L-fucosidase [Bacteroidales bacterium]
MKRALMIIILFAVAAGYLPAQEHESPYIPPADPLVLKNLEEWQDMKFGIFMHWGTYSQWGIVESWSLCPEDEGWTQRKGEFSDNYFRYKMAYENLQTSFNPVDFNPEKWAAAAKEAGFKYVVFTFKHHDGFCMFDTRLTDYKITSPKAPFHSNPKANVGLEVCKAFRNEGFKVGAYFSKPDWHCPDYWWPYFPPKDRNVNYDPARYPDRWNAFKEFTYKQIEEILTGYGKIDILWLDGGWVRPMSTVDKNVEWQRGIVYDQDIDMASIAKMGRKNQPGLIVVDRSVGTEFENYRTPEQQIPDKPLGYPWETCMTMGNSWSYVPGDTYKSVWTIVHNLVDIVAKGGNYLLNIGPSPLGDYDPVAYDRLKGIGEWMKVNGDAIYATRPVAPYKEGNICFTRTKNGAVNAIYLAAENEKILPETIVIKGITPKKKTDITLLGAKGNLKWKTVNGITTIAIPDKLRKNPPCRYAWTFRISEVDQK